MESIRLDKTIYRGKKEILHFVVKGNKIESKYQFVIKANLDITSDRLVLKRTANLLDGSNEQINKEYDSELDITNIYVYLTKADTHDLTGSLYYYDLDEKYDDNEADTPYFGEVTLIWDVQTDFDGTALPDNAVRYMMVDAREVESINLIPITKEINGEMKFELITINELKTLLGIN